MTSSLSKLASGKRVQSAGDDFAAYVRAAGLNTDITTYQNTRQDLQNAKGAVDYSLGVGNAVLEDLQKLSDLQALYNAAGATADQQAAYSVEYDAIVNRISETTTNAAYDGTSVYGTASIIAAGTIDVTATNAATAGNVTAGGIGSDDVATEITAAQAYVADISSFQTAVNREMKLNDTIIAGKEATVSALINVDEVKELANVTNLQVRQQATVSMMSQANVSNASLARLFM
jgi:flagellin